MGVSPRDDSARHRLITSAQTLFHAGSYESIGVQELCDHAQVRRGSFYYYFRSKHELGLAALEADWNSLRDEIYEPAFGDEGLTPVARFDRFFDLFEDYYGKRVDPAGRFGGCPIVNISEEMATIDAEIRDRIAGYFDEATGFFQEAATEAAAAGELELADPADAGRQIFAFVLGMLVYSKAQADVTLLAAMRPSIETLVS